MNLPLILSYKHLPPCSTCHTCSTSKTSSYLVSGRWQAPAAVLPPEGPEDEQSPVPVLALASATICFSRFSQKSRFSWHYLGPLMTAKMHENFSRVLYSQYKHRVKKSKQFVDQVKSYVRLKFRKNAAFVSIWVTTYIPTRISRERTQFCQKSYIFGRA